MSGHSKWATTKRHKAAVDAKRGKIFSVFSKELALSARDGGGDPDFNPRLRTLMAKAKAANMPKGNIARAIQRGVGGGDGGPLEELLYEGYAVDGAGLLIEVVTDNRNRSVAEVRNALNRLGGTLAASGSVAWQFETRGAIEIRLDGHDPEDLELAAIDVGAIDVEHTGESVYVYTDATDLARVKNELAAQGADIASAELTMTPTTPMTLDDNRARRVLGMIESIEDLDDVRRVHSNLELSDTLLERIGV